MIIEKGGRHQGETAKMKLEMFDVLLDAYMELVREKQLQDKDYKPKVIVISRKHMVVKKPTNFDKITSSADVLLDFLDKHTDFCTVDRCKECHDFATMGCRECIRQWLQEECKDE